MIQVVRCRGRRTPWWLLARASSASNKTPFVSSHFVPQQHEFKKVLESLGECKTMEEGHIQVKVCTLCDKQRKYDSDNLWKLRIFNSGSYHCFRCKELPHGSGNWYDLKKRIFGSGNVPEVTRPTQTPKLAVPAKIPDTIPLFGHEVGTDNGKRALEVLHYLNSVRGLDNIVIMKYGVGMAVEKFMSDKDSKIWEDNLCVTFPWMKPSEKDPNMFENVRLKYRSLKSKGKQRTLPKGGEWGFFGWQLVLSHHKQVIITEGEYDAMAVTQALGQLRKQIETTEKAVAAATAGVSNVNVAPNGVDVNTASPSVVMPATRKRNKAVSAADASSANWAVYYKHLVDTPAISLPNGCNSLPPELIAMLEQFEKIYLWLDNDSAGQVAAGKFVEKLGFKRCVVVRPVDTMENPPKDANDALRQNNPKLIPMLLDQATAMSHERIHRFTDYRSAILSAIKSRTDREGTQTPSLSALSEICKGFRPGELVVFTGPTGAGKTTILSQLSIDFAKQGAPTLWASFEVLNAKLIEKMLAQSYPGGSLKKLPDAQLNKVADDFAALPLLFLNYYGASDIEDVLQAMEYAVYQDDVKHIILDNLQFMLPRGFKGNFDKFDIQDVAIEKLRRFATEKQVNIILVVHPRKVNEGTMLSLASVFGSAKATQEADMVLVLQGRRQAHFTSIDVQKNRYDGTLGKVYIQYSPQLHKFTEANDQREAAEVIQAELQGGLQTGYGGNGGNGSRGRGATTKTGAGAGKKGGSKKATKNEEIESTEEVGEEEIVQTQKSSVAATVKGTKWTKKKSAPAGASSSVSSPPAAPIVEVEFTPIDNVKVQPQVEAITPVAVGVGVGVTPPKKKRGRKAAADKEKDKEDKPAIEVEAEVEAAETVAEKGKVKKPRKVKAVAKESADSSGNSGRGEDKKVTKPRATNSKTKKSIATTSTATAASDASTAPSTPVTASSTSEPRAVQAAPKKKAASGYLLFSSFERLRLKAQMPELKGPSVMKELGVRWKALSNNEREVWNKKAKEQ